MKITGPGKRLAIPGVSLAAILLVIALTATSGCAFFAAKEISRPNNSLPIEISVSLKPAATVTTIPQTTNPQPSIVITSVPKMGKKDQIKGRVSGVNPADYSVVVYIYVDGWWGPKPYWDKPLTSIGNDGTWSCNMITTTTDGLATKVIAYVVPNGYNPPKLDGRKDLPAEMANVPYTMVER